MVLAVQVDAVRGRAVPVPVDPVPVVRARVVQVVVHRREPPGGSRRLASNGLRVGSVSPIRTSRNHSKPTALLARDLLP
jgi:hypothetical protein